MQCRWEVSEWGRGCGGKKAKAENVIGMVEKKCDDEGPCVYLQH